MAPGGMGRGGYPAAGGYPPSGELSFSLLRGCLGEGGWLGEGGGRVVC